MPIVTHFGLHQSYGLSFLHERDASLCVSPNIDYDPSVVSPFEVRAQAKLDCPHGLFSTATVLREKSFPGSVPEWVTKLAPRRDGGAYFIPQQYVETVREALTMHRQTAPLVWSLWTTKVQRLVPQLNITNLSPLVITDYKIGDLDALRMLIRQPRVRTLIFCGDYHISGLIPLEPDEFECDWQNAGWPLMMSYVTEVLP